MLLKTFEFFHTVNIQHQFNKQEKIFSASETSHGKYQKQILKSGTQPLLVLTFEKLFTCKQKPINNT